MSDPLPPLGLDDLRCTAPDRDCEQRFYAEDTLQVARDKVAAGYHAAVVADVLLQLDPAELAGVLAEALTPPAPIPTDDIDTLCDVVEAHMEMIGGDDDVSDEEAIERMAWDQAWQRVRAWLRTLP